MMSGTFRERLLESRARSNSLSKCPDLGQDAQIMEPVEVKIKTLPRRQQPPQQPPQPPQQPPLINLEIPPPPAATEPEHKEAARGEDSRGGGGGSAVYMEDSRGGGGGSAVYMAEPAIIIDSEDNDGGECVDTAH